MNMSLDLVLTVNAPGRYAELVAKLFLLQFYIFGYGFVRLRKKLFTIAGLWLQTFLLVFLASLENLKFRNEIIL